MQKQYSIAALVFHEFELLDLFGPLEMFGMYPESFDISIVGQSSDLVASTQGPAVAVDNTFNPARQFDILLVPGGRGTRREVSNRPLLDWLIAQAADAAWVTSVCTGSALLAAAGLLENRRATTNKNAFNWVAGHGSNVEWVKQARWVEDKNYFTSSGVSAGIDMSLAVIAAILGQEQAQQAANRTEYDWHKDPDWDPFAQLAGLV